MLIGLGWDELRAGEPKYGIQEFGWDEWLEATSLTPHAGLPLGVLSFPRSVHLTCKTQVRSQRHRLAVAISASTPLAQSGAQAPTSPAAPQATFRAATNLVEVDVVVLDKDGRFVPGLTAEDLDVFEDGKRQTVQQFYLVTNAQAGGSTRDETAPRPAATDPRGRRIFVFMFDEGHLSRDSLRA